LYASRYLKDVPVDAVYLIFIYMSTAFSFKARTDLRAVEVVAKSVGAHLASKLQCFHSDERTLTDELCDMTCIWLRGSHQIGH